MTNRWPAEWETHAGTIIAWPGRPEVWGDHLRLGRTETLVLANRIAEYEPVTIFANSSEVAYVQLNKGENVRVEEIPIDDCWARDISPLFAIVDKRIRAVNFQFNAWGSKFDPVESDREFGRRISRLLDFELAEVDLVLEGGSLSTDGNGTAIAVESTILNSNRNPLQTKAKVEAVLARTLGIEKVIWLPFGLLDDSDTDGHVDNVAIFCAPGRVLVQVAPRSDHADKERLQHNEKALRQARDARGRQLDIVPVPWLPYSPFDRQRPSSYINSYPANGAVFVPVVESSTDAAALDLVGRAFGLPAVPISSRALSFGGGGPHCMTMQIPTT